MREVGAVLAYLALYAALLAGMHLQQGYELEEPLFVLVVYGAAFTTLAWLLTIGAERRVVPVREPARETTLLLAYLVFLALFITFGFQLVRSLSSIPGVQHAGIVASKLIVFVLVPFLIWRRRFGYGLGDFVELRRGLAGNWIAFIGMGAALVAFQLVFGKAGRELPALGASAGEIGIAGVLALALATLEAGLVEEYFFRTLLLERLAARLRSPGVALVLTSILFGLAHAPGLYLRPELTGESLEAHSLLFAVGYSIVILSVAGFMFGMLWLRTRNLVLVALLHGLNDSVPALADTVRWLRSLAG